MENPDKVNSTDFSVPEDFSLNEGNASKLKIEQSNNRSAYHIVVSHKSVNDSVKQFKGRFENETVKTAKYELNNNTLGTIVKVSENDTNKTLRYDYFIKLDDETCYHMAEKGKHNTTAIDYILSPFSK
jgi:hypothetical protein